MRHPHLPVQKYSVYSDALNARPDVTRLLPCIAIANQPVGKAGKSTQSTSSFVASTHKIYQCPTHTVQYHHHIITPRNTQFEITIATMAPFWRVRSHTTSRPCRQEKMKERQLDDDDVSLSSTRSTTSSRSSSSSSSCLITEGSVTRRSSLSLSVSFFPEVIQVDHIHRTDMTEEEKANVWYTAVELKSSRRNARDIQRNLGLWV